MADEDTALLESRYAALLESLDVVPSHGFDVELVRRSGLGRPVRQLKTAAVERGRELDRLEAVLGKGVDVVSDALGGDDRDVGEVKDAPEAHAELAGLLSFLVLAALGGCGEVVPVVPGHDRRVGDHQAVRLELHRQRPGAFLLGGGVIGVLQLLTQDRTGLVSGQPASKEPCRVNANLASRPYDLASLPSSRRRPRSVNAKYLYGLNAPGVTFDGA